MLSIIIPVLNEAGTIAKLLEHLSENANPEHITEIIAVDGGSTDETVKILQTLSEKHISFNLKLVHAKKGRASQMNAGAAIATGKILYFLHADSFPPKKFDGYIIDEIKKGNPAGCFRMRFNSNHWWLKLIGWFTKFSWRACRGGDQSQFITRKLFDKIGGYDENYVIYEDNILINALYARNSFVVIPHCLNTSARLYERKGVFYVQYHFLYIYFKRWRGADAGELLAYYKKHLRYNQNTGNVPIEETQNIITE
jgi:rSAM/selenodomain-associated transferase 2